jgi:NhaP-type Na+/H+ or K+/H+ antiporter
LISLLIPFGAYLLAEYLHCSGILLSGNKTGLPK